MNFNSEILSNTPTHKCGDVEYKVFTSTIRHDGNATAEIMNGEHEGKWTTVNMNCLEKI